MCCSCWSTPLEVVDTTARAVELVGQLYELEPTAGPLHVEIDDWNVDWEGSIEPMYEIPARISGDGFVIPGYPDHYSAETHAICDELAVLLNAMTVPQRYTVLVIHDRCPELYGEGSWKDRVEEEE